MVYSATWANCGPHSTTAPPIGRLAVTMIRSYINSRPCRAAFSFTHPQSNSDRIA